MSIPGKWKRRWKDPETGSHLEYLNHSQEQSVPGAGRVQAGNRTCLRWLSAEMLLKVLLQKVRTGFPFLKGRTRNVAPPNRGASVGQLLPSPELRTRCAAWCPWSSVGSGWGNKASWQELWEDMGAIRSPEAG